MIIFRLQINIVIHYNWITQKHKFRFHKLNFILIKILNNVSKKIVNPSTY